jgi:CarboxypepD_reg-like domain
MKITFIAFIIFLISSPVFSQYTITGLVIDSTSKEPLRGASVFCQNTTLGTATNKEGEFSLALKSGGYDLIISFSGYQTITKRISGDEGKLEIAMARNEKELMEVVIQTSNEVPDGWAKYGNFFTENFIGTTPNAANCKLENPEMLKFYYLKKSDKIRVLATGPLMIKNESLGYNMTYQLDSFVYYNKTNISTYRGFCFFSEMDGTDSMKLKWVANRKKAYLGSILHFVRSYYDSTLAEDGWLIEMLDENDDKKFNRITDPYDSTFYGYADSTNEVDIWYPRKLTVIYSKKKPEAEYIKKFKLPKIVSTQLSYIDLNDVITIQPNGYYYEQKDWINQGYWSWKNLADLLPYDYEPD